jgi:hypothetical protein
LSKYALEFDTDKGPKGHNYTAIYPKYFSSLRKKPINFLEIGLYKGNSAKLWEHYFPRAELHFVDQTSKHLQYYSKRSKYHFMNQTDKPKMRRLGHLYGPFDIIIDDAAHTSEDIITTFELMLPFVKPGGMYIIEDLHTVYFNMFGG